MLEPAPSLLIVDGDQEFARVLAGEAEARGYCTRAVGSVAEALALIQQSTFDAALVDLAPGAETAFELLTQLKRASADTEVIVMSDRLSMAAAIQWFDPDAFAFVRKSDVVQLFGALTRALERRRITNQNERLLWELRTINEVVSELTDSLDLQDVTGGALQRLVRAMNATSGSIRIRDEHTGDYRVESSIGPSLLDALTPHGAGQIERPSDRVIASRTPVVVEDFAAGLDAESAAALPVRSAISVPLVAGAQLMGMLSLASSRPRRFSSADIRLLTTIAAQIVVAVQNAELHRSVLRAKREWEQTFDAISDPIAVFNHRGELLRGNRALAAHLGLPLTGLRHLTCADVGFCGDGTCPSCAVCQPLGEQGSQAEVTLPSGQIFSVTTFPIGLPSAGPSVVQIAKNVTEEIHSARKLRQLTEEVTAANERLVAAMEQLKTTQAQLLQVEKLSAVGHLVAGVAHELNNPLTAVIGYAQLLEEEYRDGSSARAPGEIAQDLRQIASEAGRAAKTVRHLLAFARRQGGQRTLQSPGEIGTRVLALREYELKALGITLNTAFPLDIPDIFVDEGQLQQVLLNLLLNAEQALQGRDVKRLAIALRHDEHADAVELSVTDTGHGIAPANLGRVFDPFFTTRRVGEGSGLGLSICYGIVRAHGGHIGLDSKLDVGTTVRVLLPARLADPGVASTHVLVIHPERSELDFLTAALNGWGYPTRACATLEDALETPGENRARIIIVDRALAAAAPDAWRRVRQGADPQAFAVLTSMVPDERPISGFSREEVEAALVAPFELRALRAAVRAGSKECV